MPTFTYTGDTPMDFPADDGVNQSVSVAPGDTVELDHNPDPAWFTEAGDKAEEPAKAPAKAATKSKE